MVSAVTYPDAPVSTVASFVTEAGNPGATLVSERPDPEPIEITEIQASAPGSESKNENLNEEFTTLQNTGDTAIDLSGYTIFFGRGEQSYTFIGIILGAGETVTVRGGSGENTQSTVYTGSTDSVLNDSNPDTVFIINEDGIVLDQESYPPS